MSDTRISNASAIAMLNALTARYNIGGAGYVQIRTGSAPANLEDAATGTLLGTMPLSATAFPSAVDGTGKASATANAITSDNAADATGTAGWFRAFNGDGTAISQGDISEAGGGGDMIVDDTAIEAGDIINVVSWVLHMPEA